MPVYYAKGDKRELYFIGNQAGYTGIYKLAMRSAMQVQRGSEPPDPEEVIKGDKTDEFEAFHLFQSKLDISREGILAFVTKSGENDALHLYDVNAEKVIDSYHFNDLVVIGSPSWAPDGKRIVLSAVDKAGNNDLYIWDTEGKTLDRLTNDIYDDRDPAWSPDGKRIVFASDRSSYGAQGKYNLFLLNLENHGIRYLTFGNAHYSTPVWSRDGNSLVFCSNESGARNIWMMRFDSASLQPGGIPKTMRRVTAFTTAAFDPAWADSALVFCGFENFGFQLRQIDDPRAVYDTSSVVRMLDADPHDVAWTPARVGGNSEQSALKYKGEYSLDVAESDISTDPVFGTNGGAFLALSDLLGNDQYYFLLYNTAQSQDELLSSFNIAISRVSLSRRANYAYGVFRFNGRRYDMTVDPDNYYYEKVFGGYFALSYPISRFRRIETNTSLSSSQREIFLGLGTRQALFLSNAVSYVHDNSTWGPSGPLDGNRFILTLSYTTDIQYSNANYYSLIFDYRKYIRLSSRSAYASRYWAFLNDGKESRRFFMGGSWDLRGYPRFGLRGRRLWLTSHELRFPFIDQVAVRFPFGGISFVGLRGAVFFDAGNAWDNEYTDTKGSMGFGIRMNLGGYLVLRYDLGKRIENDFTKIQSDLFQQFFFGWDF